MSESKRSEEKILPWLYDLFVGHPNYIPTGWIGFHVSKGTVDNPQHLSFLHNRIDLIHISNRWKKGALSSNPVEIRHQPPPHCAKTGETIWFRVIHDKGNPLRRGQIQKYERYMATLAGELAAATSDVEWILKVRSITMLQTKEHVFASS